MPCNFCCDIDLDTLDPGDGYPRRASFGDLKESALSGYESCSLIEAAHQLHEGGFLDEKWCGSAEDIQIMMRRADFGMIEVSQIERRKSNY